MKDILKRHRDDFFQNKKGLTFQDIQTVYRISKNLRDKLVRGTINKDKTLGMTVPCNKPYITCPKMDYSNVITSNKNISYKIPEKFNC